MNLSWSIVAVTNAILAVSLMYFYSMGDGYEYANVSILCFAAALLSFREALRD